MKKIHLLAFLAIILFAIPSCEEEPTEVNVDLQATDIEFSTSDIDPALQDFAGTATIRGIVTNIGDDRFSSSTGQQTIELYEIQLGSTTPVKVDSTNFTTLDAGATLEVSYTRDWDLSSPAEGEFPPNYQLVISYDPDIQIDGNENNNDADASNNTLEESGQQINDMF